MTKRLAIGSALAALAVGCGRPDFNTDLNEEGPPEVVLVAVASQSAGEAATFCSNKVAPDRTNANYCPEEGADAVGPVTDVQPMGFYVRFVFDELLDPSIETIDDTNGVGGLSGTPVDITCDGAAVSYTGFYDPSGSHLTYPAGPGLVVELDDEVKTGTDCTATIGDAVKDKSGEGVPMADRGPYNFTLAVLSALAFEPEDAAEDVDPAAVITLQFNNHIDDATLAGKITVNDGAADVAVTIAVNADDDSVVEVTPDAGSFAASTTFTVTVAEGIADTKGGTLSADDAFTFSFTTGTGA